MTTTTHPVRSPALLATLEKMRKATIFGNAHDDAPVMALCDRVLFDATASMGDKIEALRKLNEVMGLTEEDSPCIPELVRLYLEENAR